MGYRACNSLYVAPAPLSAGGSSKMASKVRNRVRNVRVVGWRAGAEHGTVWILRCSYPRDWRTFSRQNPHDLVEDAGGRHETARAALGATPPRLGNPAGRRPPQTPQRVGR